MINFGPDIYHANGLKFCIDGRNFVGDNPIVIWNSSRQPIRISVPAHDGLLFRWNAVSEVVNDNNTISIQVFPKTPFPPLRAGLVEGDLDTEVMQVSGVSLSNSETGVIEIHVSVQYPIVSSSVAINMMPNPPGDDMAAPGGEYIDIINVSGRSLNINGLRIDEMMFPSGKEGVFVTLANIPRFPTGKTLRVFTRAKSNALDRVDNFDGPNQANVVWFFYEGRKTAVWNNAVNDTAFLFDQCGTLILTHKFTRGFRHPLKKRLEQVAPPKFFPVDPTIWTKVLSGLDEGDVIRISGIGGAITWFNFFNGGRMRLADGREIGNNHTEVAPDGPQTSDFTERFFPLPGANSCSLIGFLWNSADTPDAENRQTSLSAAVRMTDIGLRNTDIVVPETASVNRPDKPFDFYLGVNDDVLHDNGSEFFCTVERLRIL